MKKGKPEDFPHLNVPRPGVEPGRLAALVFETNASTKVIQKNKTAKFYSKNIKKS